MNAKKSGKIFAESDRNFGRFLIGTEQEGSELKVKARNGKTRKRTERIVTEKKGSETNGKDRNRTGRLGAERKGSERNGKTRKRTERPINKRKGSEPNIMKNIATTTNSVCGCLTSHIKPHLKD